MKGAMAKALYITLVAFLAAWPFGGRGSTLFHGLFRRPRLANLC
jgi:hypothetical protein